MNTAKLVNSALTGGGLIYPENLNVIIGNEDHGYPKGYVLDANAVSSLNQTSGSGNNGSGQQHVDNLGFKLLSNKVRYNKINSDVTINSVLLESTQNDRKNILLSDESDYNNKMSIINGSNNIVTGVRNFTSGHSSVVLGKTVASKGYYSISVGAQTAIPVIKNTENNNLRIKVKTNSFAEELLKKGFLYIIPWFSVKNNVVQRNDSTENEIINVINYTRISNDVVQFDDSRLQALKDSEKAVLLGIRNESDTSITVGNLIQSVNGNKSISVGYALRNEAVNNVYPNTYQLFGTLNTVKSDFEFACGSRNVSTKTSDFSTRFSIGVGLAPSDYRNGFEVGYKKVGTTFEPNVYVLGIGNYNGKNAADSNVKSLQQVISEIQNNSSSTTQPVVDNGPWDVDITSKFVKGNVNISPSAMWTINQGYKRVYLETKLNQGDIIKIPNTIRMYIGWKDASGQFGMANWTQAGTTYTATVDGDYVILLDTPSANNPGIEPATLSSFGKVTLHTSNVAYKPNSGGSQPSGTTQTVVLPKDHTRDDRVMKSVAHQGYHATERANSLAAFRAAAKEGWQYVETDIYKTSDNNWVVGHDAWMPEGYTNGTITIASGDHSYKYEEHTLAEIKAFTSPDNNKVATLQEFCKVCKQGGLHPYIEIKNPNMGGKQTGVGDKYDNKPYVHKALDIIRREGLGKNFTIISSGNWNLEETVKYDNNIRVGYINVFEMYNVGNDVNKKYWDTVTINLTKIINAGMGRAVYLFLDQNLMHVATCPAENMDWLMDKKIALEVWTAKTANDLDNLDPYITGVTCDNIHAGEILAKNI